MGVFRGYRTARVSVSEEAFAGPNPYVVGAQTRTLLKTHSVERVTSISITGGYLVEVAAVAANVVTYTVTNPRALIAAADVVAAVANHPAADIVAGLANHAAVDVVAAIIDHPQADIVGAIADHAAHGHDITTVVPAGGGGAITDPAIPGPLESAGGGQVNAGAVDVLAAAQAHAAGAAAVAHAAGAAVAHGVGVAVAHAAGAAVAAAQGAEVGAINLAGETITIVTEGYQ